MQRQPYEKTDARAEPARLTLICYQSSVFTRRHGGHIGVPKQ